MVRSRHVDWLCAILVAVLAMSLACAVKGKRPPDQIPDEEEEIEEREEPVEEEVIPEIEDSPKGLKFTLNVTPQTFAIGDRVTFEASLFNEGDKVFDRTCPTSCVWDFEVISPDGEIIGPNRDCARERTELRLERGELRMIMRNWGGRSGYFGTGKSVRPGRYSITAGLVDRDGRVVPMTAPIHVKVLPRR